MSRIYLPTADMIIELHDNVLSESGGRPGIRDENIIHAAVARPKTYLSYHEERTVHIVCAVLLDSISRDHAFIEGNKRTGLMAAILTYSLNGIELKSTADRHKEFEDLVLRVVLEKPSIADIAQRLKQLTEKYRKSGVYWIVDRIKTTFFDC